MYYSHLLFGIDNLANTSPTMKAWMRHPSTDWVVMTMMASTHSVVVWRLPYPIVCCVSREKRKAPAKSCTWFDRKKNKTQFIPCSVMCQ